MARNLNNSSKILKAMEYYCKIKPQQFDTSQVLNKIKIKSVTDDHVTATFTVERNMCNMIDTLHGGYASSVIDVISLLANWHNPEKRISLTTSMHLTFMNAAQIADELTVTATTLKPGKFSVLESKIYNEATGEIVAKGTTSFVAVNDKLHERISKMLNIEDK